MKSFAFATTFLASVLAAPAALSARQTTGPEITEVVFRVSNLENPATPKWVDTSVTVNGGAITFDQSNDLVGACDTCLNTGGHVVATRLDILTPLSAIHCHLYNREKHVIAEFNNLILGFEFGGIEAINADSYSFLCYYV